MNNFEIRLVGFIVGNTNLKLLARRQKYVKSKEKGPLQYVQLNIGLKSSRKTTRALNTLKYPLVVADSGAILSAVEMTILSTSIRR